MLAVVNKRRRIYLLNLQRCKNYVSQRCFKLLNSYLVACLLQLESSMSGESGAGASVGLWWAAIRPLNFSRRETIDLQHNEQEIIRTANKIIWKRDFS
jgi:hypothetical protein